MDFLFTPEQDEAAELAARILADRTTNERLKEVEAGGDRFDRALWTDLAEAGLLTLHLSEEYDGAGFSAEASYKLTRFVDRDGYWTAPSA